MKKPYLKKNNEQGFSLIEFIVVLVIFSIMSGTSLFNFNKYQRNLEQTNIAQDIALTLRQAQVYGLSGSDRTIGSQNLDEQGIADDVFGVDGDANDFFGDTQILNIANDRSIRGVSIDVETQELIIFEDLNRNYEYDAPGSSTAGDRIIDVRKILARGVDISVCLIHEDDVPSPVGDCSESVTSFENQGPVSIVFQRPYPDAYILYNGEEDYRYVYIELSNNQESSRYIEISPIGNISVRNYEQ